MEDDRENNTIGIFTTVHAQWVLIIGGRRGKLTIYANNSR